MKEEGILGKLVFDTELAIDRALQKHFGCRLWQLKKVEDRLRLVAFRVWAEKYHVEIDEVVEIVVGFYRQMFAKKFRHAPVFGATIPTVTGQHAERILVEGLKKKYPEHENETNWIQRERNRQLALLDKVSRKQSREPITIHAASDDAVKNFLSGYSKSVKQKQERNTRPLTLRRYRGCPW